MNQDTTPIVATAGLLATLGLSDINGVISLLVGLVTLGYIVTKWIFLVKSRPFDSRDED